MEIYKKLLEEGKIYEQNARWEQALNIYINAEKIVKKYGSKIEKGNILFKKGRVLAQKGSLSAAINAFKESFKLFKKGKGTALQIANLKEAIGDAYKINGYLNDALKSFNEALKILIDERERVIYTHSHLIKQILEAIARQLSNIGKVFLELEEYDKALEKSQESLKVALDTENPSLVLDGRMTISRIYLRKGEHEKAIEYLLKSLKIIESENDKKNELQIYLELAKIYKLDERGDFALKYFKKGLKLAQKLEEKEILTRILDEIGLYYLEKNKKKMAHKYFQKSFELGSTINNYYFEYIFYHLGILDILNQKYDDAYNNLKKSLDLSKKFNNKHLLTAVLTKIGDLWNIKSNFNDSNYYYKKALENTTQQKRRLELSNKIGLNYLLMDNISKARSYFLNNFDEIKYLILLEENSRERQELKKILSEISLKLCATACMLHEKANDREALKEAIGYSEFLVSENMPNEFKIYYDRLNPPEKINTQKKINKICNLLKKLNSEYYLEENTKIKIKMRDQIKELKKDLFNLLESQWDNCDNPLESYPQNVNQIITKFFNQFSTISESWLLLKIVYVTSLNRIYIFLINIKNREIKLFSKTINKNSIKTLKNRLRDLSNGEIFKLKMKREKILNYLNNLWNKIIPKSLTSFLLKQEFDFLTIIPHSFLWNLPWETMKFKEKSIYKSFKITRALSINLLRSDCQRRTSNRLFLFIKGIERKEDKLIFLDNLTTKKINELGFNNNLLKYLLTELEKNKDTIETLRNFRTRLYNQEISIIPNQTEIYHPNSFLLIGIPIAGII
ncbi:MAG: tetratricopeptide repeat protein [Candidatus Helarchaeota archaeon]